MNTLKAYLKIDLIRLLPFLGVMGILIFIGTGFLYVPNREFSQMGFLLLRHQVIIFGLILGADLVARDREQKTRTTMDALPRSPSIVFIGRTLMRLTAIVLLWLMVIIYTEYFLGAVLPGSDKVSTLVSWWQREIATGNQISIIILSIFTYFAGTLCSMFTPDTLTAIGATAGLAVVGSTANSFYKNGLIWIILVMIFVLAGVSLVIYTSRQPWDLRTQAKRLLLGLALIVLAFLVF